jgi:hypothetical protein
MQKRNIILLLCALVIPIVSACQSETTPTSAPIPWPSTAPSASPSADPVAIQQEKQAILQEIYTLVDQYNTFLEKEKLTGNYQTIQLPDGSQGVQFINESGGKVFTELLRVNEEITKLNEKYYELSIQKGLPTSYPNGNAEIYNLGELQSQYSTWLTKELETGMKIQIPTEDGTILNKVIGDSYVAKKVWENKIAIAQGKANQEYQKTINSELDIQVIQRIEGGNVPVKFTEAAPSPYRASRTYSVYETEEKYYTLDSRLRLVVFILPKNMPQGVEGLSVQELEKMARDMIALVSPEVNLGPLTYTFNQKIGTYFFRWEDLTKPLLDDGRSYPFVQVGMNGKGELLNYYNTLSMSR